MTEKASLPLRSGFIAFVKRDCPTCELIVPVLESLDGLVSLMVYSQDDPSFPDQVETLDDTDLEFSWRNRVETVPTLIKVEEGREVARVIGWHRG